MILVKRFVFVQKLRKDRALEPKWLLADELRTKNWVVSRYTTTYPPEN